MKTKLQFAALLLPLCLLAGCGNSTESQADSSLADTTETTTGTTAATTAADTETTAETTETTDSETTASSDSTTEAVTTTAATSTGPMFTVTVPANKAQGGEGGEEHAEDPDPDYFTYQFAADGVILKLSGGTYQAIAYDFSKTADKGLDRDFFLLDANFDGKPDLFAPAEIKDGMITYAVFVWNEETKKFADYPVLIDNPNINAEKQTVTSTRKLGDSSVMLTGYVWQGGTLAQNYIVYADFSKKTISYKTLADGQIALTDFLTTAELSEKLRSYQ